MATSSPLHFLFVLSVQVLMVDTKTSKPLPFGTLGIHKVSTYSNVFVVTMLG